MENRFWIQDWQTHLEFYYVAFIGDTVVGSYNISIYDDWSLLSGLFINESFRGQGIGTLLMKDAINRYQPYLDKDLFLVVDNKFGKKSQTAKFYRKFGFKYVKGRELEQNGSWMKLKI